MIALEIAISKVLIDVATSAAIDVITKRSINPVIRGAGGAYKVYSLINPAIGIHNCLRISAYSDALGILAHEVVVTVASKELANALVQINGANFEVHREAEQYLLEPEFSEGLLPSGVLISRWLYQPGNVGGRSTHSVVDDYTECGRF